MCLALPALVVDRLNAERITIDLGGVRKVISAALTPEVQPGDYVIVHVGYAIGVVDPIEAARTLELFCGPGRSPAGGGTPSLAVPSRYRCRSERMKYIDEFRDGELAQHIAARIRAEAHPGHAYRLMEFCGGHTHAISRYGVADPAARQRQDDPRPRLPGVRAAHRPRGPRHPAGPWTTT